MRQLLEESPYKGYAVVACNPNCREDGELLLGLPMYVVIKDGIGQIAAGEIFEELLFGDVDD